MLSFCKFSISQDFILNSKTCKIKYKKIKVQSIILIIWTKYEISFQFFWRTFIWCYLSFMKKCCTCNEKRFIRIAYVSVIDKNPLLDWIYIQRVISDLLWKSGTRSRTFSCLHQYRAKSTTECALCNYCFVNLFDSKIR